MIARASVNELAHSRAISLELFAFRNPTLFDSKVIHALQHLFKHLLGLQPSYLGDSDVHTEVSVLLRIKAT